ncbi:MAG: hypothetical protein V3W14_11615 [Candidatus Neomarinimicrobiota bacterium]
MNAPEYEELNPIFEQSAVDLPPSLQAKLMAIPDVVWPISYRAVAWVVVAGIAATALLLPFREKFFDFWDRSTTGLERMVIASRDFLVELAYLASLPEPELAVMNALGLLALAVIGFVMWLSLRADRQNVRLYTHQLAGQA